MATSSTVLPAETRALQDNVLRNACKSLHSDATSHLKVSYCSNDRLLLDEPVLLFELWYLYQWVLGSTPRQVTNNNYVFRSGILM